MTVRFRRTTVDTDIEEQILTGLIVSTKVCRELRDVIKPEYFEIPWSRVLATWVMDYYTQFNAAPERNVQDIYNVERENLPEETADLLAAFLQNLSTTYENQTTGLNEDFLIARAITHFRNRNIDLTLEEVQSLRRIGRNEEAELRLMQHCQVARVVGGWVNPFSQEFIDNYYESLDAHGNNENVVFQFPGDLGRLLGPFETGWLVGILGPMKRGKSFWLEECAILSAIARKPTAYISLEMNNNTNAERLFKRITAMGDNGGNYLYPVADCQKNQSNECHLPQRTCRTRLLDDTNQKPAFADAPPAYTACAVCRTTEPDLYVADSWLTIVERKTLSERAVRSGARGFVLRYGSNMRIKSYPAYSANLRKIKADLDFLAMSEGFYPKTIVIDYADILAPDNPKLTGRDRVDDTWKLLKNLADERKCLVVTASQSNRKSIEKKTIGQVDTGEDIRKVAHVDVMFGLNQTPVEKRRRVMRIGVVAHRHQDDAVGSQVLVMQQLQVGQVLLDSLRVPSRWSAEES